MANSRYDNIKVYHNGNFIIPQQIKVYNGSSWVDLGAKDSYSTKKLNVRYNNNFLCATYYRQDVNIPKTFQIGSGGKCADILKGNDSICAVDNWQAGYSWEMVLEATETTPLYTCYAKNQGDITNQAYFTYYAVREGNAFKLRLKSRFHGTKVSDRKYADSTVDWSTPVIWVPGEKVRINITKTSRNGSAIIKVYNMSGTEIYSGSHYENTMQVGTPNIHRIGSETINDNGGQSQYGNAKIYSFEFTPNRTDLFSISAENANVGSTIIYSTGYDGYISMDNTSVYGASYAEYIRQTI